MTKKYKYSLRNSDHTFKECEAETLTEAMAKTGFDKTHFVMFQAYCMAVLKPRSHTGLNFIGVVWEYIEE